MGAKAGKGVVDIPTRLLLCGQRWHHESLHMLLGDPEIDPRLFCDGGE